jgi:hypothetical protein
MHFLITFLLAICLNPLFNIAYSNEGRFSFDKQRRSVTIPVHISQNLIIVPVSINNSPPLNFILDSGVNTTILTEPLLAQLLDIESERPAFIMGLGGTGVIEAGMATGVNISLPGISGNNLKMIILPEGVLSFSQFFGFPVHGILGHDLFKEFPIRVNYRQQIVKVFRQTNYRIPRRAAVIPLAIRNNKPYINVSVKGYDGSIVDSLNLLVDLGASYPVYLNYRYRGLSEKIIPSFLGKGLSGELTGQKGRIQKLNIKNFTLKNPTIAYPEKDFLVDSNIMEQWDGIIGGGVLKRFHVIFDYQSQRLVLWKNKNFNDPFTTNLSGMEIITDGARFDEYKVSYVRQNSTAYEQGIRPGDQLLSLNKRDIANIGMRQLYNLLNQNKGDRINLRIKRNGEILEKSILLREDLP